MPEPFDSVLLIGFGGPDKLEDVRPFLTNVLRGVRVPPERIEDVVHHYEAIGGKSPLNDYTFRQARGLEAELARSGPGLPVYVGMRNWHPLLADTLKEMDRDRHKQAVGFIMAAYQSQASWGKYMESVSAAREEVGVAPEVVYASDWHDHPLFVEAQAEQLRAALERIPAERRAAAAVIFTAHSIPVAMAAVSPYVQQLHETSELVARRLGLPCWTLAYQSRSGNPRDPWLEPDVGDVIRARAAERVRDVVLVPVGFLCDHVEVLYDLDTEARQVAQELGIGFQRAQTVNDHPKFIAMMADVVRRTVATS